MTVSYFWALLFWLMRITVCKLKFSLFLFDDIIVNPDKPGTPLSISFSFLKSIRNFLSFYWFLYWNKNWYMNLPGHPSASLIVYRSFYYFDLYSCFSYQVPSHHLSYHSQIVYLAQAQDALSLGNKDTWIQWIFLPLRPWEIQSFTVPLNN